MPIINILGAIIRYRIHRHLRVGNQEALIIAYSDNAYVLPARAPCPWARRRRRRCAVRTLPSPLRRPSLLRAHTPSLMREERALPHHRGRGGGGFVIVLDVRV